MDARKTPSTHGDSRKYSENTSDDNDNWFSRHIFISHNDTTNTTDWNPWSFRRCVRRVVVRDKFEYLICRWRKISFHLLGIPCDRNSRPSGTVHLTPSVVYRRPSTVLHIPPILPPHLKQRPRNLAQRTYPHRFHQLRENITVFHRYFLQFPERGARLERVGSV